MSAVAHESFHNKIQKMENGMKTQQNMLWLTALARELQPLSWYSENLVDGMTAHRDFSLARQ